MSRGNVHIDKTHAFHYTEAMKRFTFDLNPHDERVFREALSALGLVSKRGPLAGQGSPQSLADAIASGRVLIVQNPAYIDKNGGSQPHQ